MAEPQHQMAEVQAVHRSGAWHAPGFISIVALLFLVVGFVVGTSGPASESGVEADTAEVALATGADDHSDHAGGAHADGDHADGAHADGAHADGAHADGAHADGAHADGTHAAGAHAGGDHGDDHAAGAHGDGDHADGHVDGEHTDGEHIDGHTDHPADDPTHEHPAPTGPTCDFGYAYPQPHGFNETDCAVAQALVANTKAVLSARGFANYNTAVAAGYKSIGDDKLGQRFEHLVNWDYYGDNVIMDPNRVESLVYLVGAGGSRTLVSGMYILRNVGDPLPAEYSSELTPWHGHTNLCWDIVNGVNTVVGIRDSAGNCSRGFAIDTPVMLHVWIDPTPCGPFSEVEGAASGDCGHTSH